MKLCPFCKHFYLYMGSPAYSEYTPGDDAEISCNKGYWKMKNGDGENEYRKNIKKAGACADFERYHEEVE